MAGLALVLVMASGISAAPAAADGAVVPFKARYDTHPVTEPFPPFYLKVHIPAEGQATHLGERTWEATMYAYFTGLQDGTMVFTAANGDKLSGDFEGTWTGMPPGPVSFEGTFSIDDGTGRFEDATATGTYWGTAQAGEGILHFDGMLEK